MAIITHIKLSFYIFTFSLFIFLIPIDSSFALCQGEQGEYERCMNQPTVGNTRVAQGKQANCRERARNGACNATPYKPLRIMPVQEDLCYVGQCDDKDPCTLDFCNPSLYGQCFYSQVPGCGSVSIPAPLVIPQSPSQPARQPVGPAQPAAPAQSIPQPAPAPNAPAQSPIQPAQSPYQVRTIECARNKCTTASINTNGECVYNPQPDGTICTYDGNSGAPIEACLGGRCTQQISQPPLPLPLTLRDDSEEPAGPSIPNSPSISTDDSTPAIRSRPIVPASRRIEPPRITCNYGGLYYTPGQKIYECSEPREQGVCNSDAGFGIPYICSIDGTWEVSNDGIAECSNACGINSSPTANYTPYSSTSHAQACIANEINTCIYFDENEGQCYFGTNDVGFNSPNCEYTCGPVQCPKIDLSQQAPAQTDQCFGELYSSCGNNGQNMLMASWYITQKLGLGTCNVFIRDELGDHVVSHDCNAVWSGTEIPGGTQVTDDGIYELYISNGTESCYNQLGAKTQLSCDQSQPVISEVAEPVIEQSDDGDSEPSFPFTDWLSNWF